MAIDKSMFTVDASQILVKLHFSGLQAVRGDVKKYSKNGFFINTGIVNDDEKGNPDKPGKTSFDLKNSSGEYFAGIVTDFEYETTFNLENAMTDLFKLSAKIYSNGKKLLDTKNEEDKKTIDSFNEYVKMIKSAFEKANANVPDDASFQSEEGLKAIKNDLSKLQKTESSNYDKQLNNVKKDIAASIEKYMKVFAGADNVKSINDSNVIAVQVSNSIASVKDAPKFVKDFKIQPISDTEKEIINKDFNTQSLVKKDKNGRAKFKIRMCFYVKYMLKVEES